MAFLTLPSLLMGLVRYFAGREGYLQMVAGAWVDGFRLMVALWGVSSLQDFCFARRPGDCHTLILDLRI